MTDDTARAMLEGEWAGSWNDFITSRSVADLQRMARVWLEIRRGIDEKVLEQDSGDQYDYLRDLFGIAGVEDGDS